MQESIARTAILIVNGGNSDDANRWIRLCLERIEIFTDAPDYRIYLWNNRIGDAALDAWLLARPRLTLLSAAGYEKLDHPHRTPLQRLYHLAKQGGAHYIVTMDSDAHPLRAGWLNDMLSALADGAVLAGVWRDEMAPAIRPHVHPSCLCTTVDFVEKYQLRFDFDNTHSKEITDTLSHFTWVAQAHGLPIRRLVRSNQRNFHYWMGGIYGDLIYHHVAACRETVVFHNSPVKGILASDEHRHLRDKTAEFLFHHYDAYIGWLQGKEGAPNVEQNMNRLINSCVLRRSVAWWLQRMRSSYLRSVVGRGILKRLNHVTENWWLRIMADGAMRRIERFRNNLGPLHVPATYSSLHRSFKEDDLKPLATHGWAVGPPDFVGIGAPKCGTTWWYDLMMQHPQIICNRVRFHTKVRAKETQYFLHFQYGDMLEQEIALYRSAFAAPLGAICGEFSVQYLGYPNCLEHLARAAPNTKILVILRNPIDRFVAHLNHLMSKRGSLYFKNRNLHERYLMNTYSFYTEAILASLYSIGLTRLFRYFDKSKILVLQYERMALAPKEELARTYHFLGVDDRFQVKNINESINQGRYVVNKPTPEDRKRLASYFKDDVLRTSALCPELDIDLWTDFAAKTFMKPAIERI